MKYTFRYGRKHNKQKAKTRKEYNNRKWEKDPLGRIKYTFNKPVHITPAEWAEYIQPVWEKYERKYLKFKCSERTMTVFNLVLSITPQGRGMLGRPPSRSLCMTVIQKQFTLQ